MSWSALFSGISKSASKLLGTKGTAKASQLVKEHGSTALFLGMNAIGSSKAKKQQALNDAAYAKQTHASSITGKLRDAYSNSDFS